MLYVVGLLFDHELENVLLMQKLKGPVNMAGRLNGIGGKIERGNSEGVAQYESAIGAMRREFGEEVGGYDLTPPDWHLFHKMRHGDDEADGSAGAVVYFYCASTANLHRAFARESEQIAVYPWKEVATGQSYPPAVYNLAYLLPMAHAYLAHPKYRWIEG